MPDVEERRVAKTTPPALGAVAHNLVKPGNSTHSVCGVYATGEQVMLRSTTSLLLSTIPMAGPILGMLTRL